MMKVFYKVIGWLFIALAFILGLIPNIKGWHDTPGELLVYYWPYWIGIVIFSLAGYFMMIRGENEDC